MSLPRPRVANHTVDPAPVVILGENGVDDADIADIAGVVVVVLQPSGVFVEPEKASQVTVAEKRIVLE